MSATLIKEQDVIVYRHEGSYSHNAVVERLPGGELVVIFQEQQRRKHRTHIDTTSRAMLVRSRDGGLTWDADGKTIVAAAPNTAIHDPSICRLQDGTLLVNFFQWRCTSEDEVPDQGVWLRVLDGDHYAWMDGTHITRSRDDGRTWEAPRRVDSPTGTDTAVSDPVIQLPGGELLMPLYGAYGGEQARVLVVRSRDGGLTWSEATTVAFDPLGHFEFVEPSLLYLPTGKLICMIRVHRRPEQEYGYYLYQSDSYDLGRTWSLPRRTSMWGHPPHLLRLQSGRLLCVYGYRRPPYGVRACLSHDEGETWDVQNELILRADGIDPDLGYPTSVQLDDGTIFTVWYLCEPVGSLALTGNAFFSYRSPLGYIGGTFYRER